MNKKEKGYISVVIQDEFIKHLLVWSETAIPKEVILQQEIDGKLEGGNVLSEAHLTLFFGLDDQLANKNKIREFIDSVNLKELRIDGIKVFHMPQMKCKILYFAVEDKGGSLRSVNNKFLELPHFKEDQKPFVPHITIAYVKDSFNESSISYDGPVIFPVKSVEYIKHN